MYCNILLYLYILHHAVFRLLQKIVLNEKVAIYFRPLHKYYLCLYLYPIKNKIVLLIFSYPTNNMCIVYVHVCASKHYLYVQIMYNRMRVIIELPYQRCMLHRDTSEI